MGVAGRRFALAVAAVLVAAGPATTRAAFTVTTGLSLGFTLPDY